MAAASETPTPRRVRICRIAGRYLIFDIADVVYLRRNHNICSVFVGTLPQNPTQNVLLGLPIELYAEETRLLVNKGVGYVVDDTTAHLSRLSNLDGSARETYIQSLRKQRRVAQDRMVAQTARKAAESEVLKQRAKSKRRQEALAAGEVAPEATDPSVPVPAAADDHEGLFSPDPDAALTRRLAPATGKSPPLAERVMLTPTTSASLVDPGADANALVVRDIDIAVPSSYALYAHLNSRGYYMTPGLRFGGHYSVYPGDPFRFHAHFLATSFGWRDEIQVLDLIGGGRLGTGVKKGFLIGGPVERLEVDERRDVPRGDDDIEGTGEVRAFTIEWAGM